MILEGWIKVTMSLFMDGRGQRSRCNHCARQGAMIVDQRTSHTARKNLICVVGDIEKTE